MTAFLIAAATVLLPLLGFWIRRKIATAEDPNEIHKKRVIQIDREIILDDAVSANVRLDDWLRAIEGDTERQNDLPTEGGKDIQSPS